MGIKITWDSEDKTILLHDYTGYWDLDDYRRAVDKTSKLLNGLDHTVHFIMDLSETHVPSNILSVMRYTENKAAANQGLIVIVGADTFVTSVFEVARRIAPTATNNTYFVNNIEEARSFITQQTGLLEAVV